MRWRSFWVSLACSSPACSLVADWTLTALFAGLVALAACVHAQCSLPGAVTLDAARIAGFNSLACRSIAATSFTIAPDLTSAQLQLPWTQVVSGHLNLTSNALLTDLSGLKNVSTVTGTLAIKVGQTSLRPRFSTHRVRCLLTHGYAQGLANVTSLFGLGALRLAGALVVQGNGRLASLQGLSAFVRTTLGSVTISVFQNCLFWSPQLVSCARTMACWAMRRCRC